MTEPPYYWQDRRAKFVTWMGTASRADLEGACLQHFDRAEVSEWCAADEHHRADMLAQRQASYAISDALDWGAQSRRPSFAELQRRRGVA
jgi:hypothetical protein